MIAPSWSLAEEKKKFSIYVSAKECFHGDVCVCVHSFMDGFRVCVCMYEHTVSVDGFRDVCVCV